MRPFVPFAPYLIAFGVPVKPYSGVNVNSPFSPTDQVPSPGTVGGKGYLLEHMFAFRSLVSDALLH